MINPYSSIEYSRKPSDLCREAQHYILRFINIMKSWPWHEKTKIGKLSPCSLGLSERVLSSKNLFSRTFPSIPSPSCSINKEIGGTSVSGIELMKFHRESYACKSCLEAISCSLSMLKTFKKFYLIELNA